MMRCILTGLLALPLALVALGQGPAGPADKVPAVVRLRAVPFDLREVRLLDGPLQRAMELDRAYLLSLDPVRLLHTFRLNAGLPSVAVPLGGWEEPKGELRGHFLGHYLSACALLYASTGDAGLRSKGRQAVAGLAECQEKLGSGYLSAFPESFFDRVERLQPVWAPYYTLHKLLAGLLDQYVYCADAQALAVARRFGDWAIARNGRLSDAQMQAMLGNEHGGMNEALANLYALTGESKYLQLARRFNHRAVLEPAMRREDRLTGLHANTQIPKFVGTARLYELTGEETLRTASAFFWDTVVRERSYVIGGHSDGEHFSAKETLSQALGPSTTETCNTYNMLKLTRHLFAWDPQAGYADYYERALYNHILASQDPASGRMCYYVPLRSGSVKTYGDPLNAFWCCTGTGIENHAKYGDSIYFHDSVDRLYVNLFVASELDWRAKGLRLRQETRFPESDRTRQKALEARMVDRVNPGEEPSERDHRFEGERTAAGDFNGRKWRHAEGGGWFAYTLRVAPGAVSELRVTYWGSDGGGREFDIQVDGTKVATQRLEGNRPGEFYDETYALPAALLDGKSAITVRFQAHPGRTAGGVFGCATLRAAAKPNE